MAGWLPGWGIGLLCLWLLAAAPTHGAPLSPEYHLLPGDVVHVQVLNRGAEQFSTDIVVQRNGRARLPIAPPTSITAAGLTLNDFEDAATRAFGGFIRDPVLIITLKSGHEPQVYVFGAVTKVGSYPIAGPVTALDAIANAGGSPLGDLSRVTLTRNGTSRSLNLQASLNSGENKDNIELQPGDRLFVPEPLPEHITVQGSVKTPSNVPYKQGMVAEDAILAAGGPADTGDFAHVTIAHTDGTQQVLDLKQLMLTGAKDTTELKPGDVVTVPEAPQSLALVGEVLRPGPVPFRAGMTLADAITLAGGTTRKADLSQIKVTHTKTATVETADLSPTGTGGATALQPGDVINVPDGSAQVFVLGAVTQPGPAPYEPGTTLLDVFGSGHQPASTADLDHAVLTHANGQKVDVNLNQLVRGGDTGQNVALKAGDTLYIPESKRLVYIFGAVNRPGAFTLNDPEHVRVLDALQMAGGPLPTADIKKAVLVQPGAIPTTGAPSAVGASASGPVGTAHPTLAQSGSGSPAGGTAAVPAAGGQVATTPLHLDLLLDKGQLQYNVALSAGDIIYVPMQGEKRPGILGSLLPYLLLIPRL